MENQVSQMEANFDLVELAAMILKQKEGLLSLIKQDDGTGWVTVQMAILSLICWATYGAAMGWSQGWRQGLASAVKVPMIFLISLVICFPALFAFGYFFGGEDDPLHLIATIFFALTLCGILLATLAPISAFFGFGSGYDFMKLLHVIFFVACGSIAMVTLSRVLGDQSGWLLRFWVFLYGFVGMEVAWKIRPFIGEPKKPFELIRKSNDGLNFYTAVARSLKKILKGESQSREQERKKAAMGFNVGETKPTAS